VPDNIRRHRIGIDVTAAITQGGGIGRYTRELVRALIRKDDSSYYILFSGKAPKRALAADPIPAASNVEYREFWLNAKWLYRLWYRVRLPISVQWLTGDIDIYHSPDFVLPPTGNIPSVLTIHDLSFVHYPEAFTPALLNYLNKAVPSSIGRASHVLADSLSTKNDLVDIWQVSKEKISVVYSGVGSSFKPITEKDEIRRVRQKYELGDRPFIFSVGTVQPRKNYEMLIRAFKPIFERTTHQLVIAGGLGWMYEQILEEASRLGMSQRVKLIGFVDDRDLPALYSDASLFAFPSLYEGFGIPLLEAMSCGVPVISSNASSLPEVAGDAALLLPPDDQELWSKNLKQLLDDNTRRSKMVAAGFLQARKYSWRNAAEQVLRIYHTLLPE
jgi:glycosyltransferase involved in cell wall biosynthesis